MGDEWKNEIKKGLLCPKCGERGLNVPTLSRHKAPKYLLCSECGHKEWLRR